MTIPSQYARLEETGRLENFRRVARGERGTHVGFVFDDSDVYKWLEAALHLQRALLAPDSAIRHLINRAVTDIAGAQAEDGYLHTFIQLQRPEARWRSLAALHELYCGGHLIEAALAGEDPRLREVALRYGRLVAREFGPGRRRGYCGHEEIEYALVGLSRATGDPEWEELARWMIDERGRRPSPFEAELSDPVARELAPGIERMLTRDGSYRGDYAQDHLPLVDQEVPEGHAVRAMYLFAAAAAAFEPSSRPDVFAALRRLWRNLVDRRLYITGGVGVSRANEGFTRDFDLPNRGGYAETCAAIGLVLWASEMFRRTGEAEYVDVAERALFNGVLAGLSRSGDRYFYENPLESDGTHHRQAWFACACCPPNVARTIAGIARLLFAEGPRSLWIAVPASGEIETQDGVRVRLETDWPWEGTVHVTFLTPAPGFTLHVRVPTWASIASLDGRPVEPGFVALGRDWRAGDEVRLDVGIEPAWQEADERVLDCAWRVALVRGPIVYCLEEHRAGGPVPHVEVSPGPVTQEREGEAVILRAEGRRLETFHGPPLYGERQAREASPASLAFAPYFDWDNGPPGTMQVWVRRGESP